VHIIWNVNLLVDPKEYYSSEGRLNEVRHKINERLVPMLEIDTQDRFLVSITPKTDSRQARRVPDMGHRHLLSQLRLTAELLRSKPMLDVVEAIEGCINRNPWLALGLTKDLMESFCKAILTRLSKRYGKSPRLSSLVDMLMKALRLVPDGISNRSRAEDLFRKMLGELSSIVWTLGELRNLYGVGHGRGVDHVGVDARHARLALASAAAFIHFMTETYLRQGGPAADAGAS